jgi:hypothetical protein
MKLMCGQLVASCKYEVLAELKLQLTSLKL